MTVKTEVLRQVMLCLAGQGRDWTFIMLEFKSVRLSGAVIGELCGHLDVV